MPLRGTTILLFREVCPLFLSTLLLLNHHLHVLDARRRSTTVDERRLNILKLTGRPSSVSAMCTCPMEAAAKGFSSKDPTLSRQLSPNSWRRALSV